MNVKELFEKAENGTLTYEQFEAAAKAAGAKFADLSEGKYVSKSKYDDDINSRMTQINDLTKTIGTRDDDLAKLRKQLEDAGTDASKLSALNTDFANLQTKYNTDIQDYQNKLAKQAYEFAVKEFAAGKKFTSQAAKRDFISSMISKELKMDNGKILGGEDFVTTYSAENADAFVVETPPTPNPNPTPIPSFVAPTPGPSNNPGNDSGFHFNFTGVRARKE